MVKKLKSKQGEPRATHIDVPLPDGTRALLPMPAYGIAVRMGMITAQLTEQERHAFNVVVTQTEYSVMRKAAAEAESPRVTLSETT
jgi:hypothetical protein